MPRPRSLIATALLALLASCALGTEPQGEDLQVRADSPHLVLRNPGDRTIYYHAIEQSTDARTFWGPCDDPGWCPQITPGDERVLPYDSVAGYAPGVKVARIYWWHLEPQQEGGFRPDHVRVAEVGF